MNKLDPIADYLAVAATKPVMYGGVPLTYMMLNLSLSAAPGLLLVLMNIEPIFILVIWGVLFFIFHKIGVHYARQDAQFMNVYLKTMSLIPRKKGATYWQGYNSYKA